MEWGNDPCISYCSGLGWTLTPTHTRVCARTHAHTHARTHTHTHARTHMRTHTHIHTHTHTHTHTLELKLTCKHASEVRTCSRQNNPMRAELALSHLEHHVTQLPPPPQLLQNPKRRLCDRLGRVHVPVGALSCHVRLCAEKL